MLTNIVVFILIIIGLILGIAPHNKLCAIPTMLGVNYCIPHWAFVYIMSPALIFWAYVMKTRERRIHRLFAGEFKRFWEKIQIPNLTPNLIPNT